MKQLTVKLKQHTPLIHFQHYQEGATLRASEVKPRLDRYILETLGNGNYKDGCDLADKNGWIIGENALNYKMRIVPESQIEISDINKLNNNGKLTPYPAYFANMNTDYNDNLNHKKFSFCENISLELKFFNTQKSLGLIDYIAQKGLLASFFMINNFGARSSKGFGSFYIDEEDDLYYEPKSKNQFKIKANNNRSFKEVFEQIDLFYKSLRSGINDKKNDETTFYFKSLIYKYCNDILKKDWDKKRIKEFYLNNIKNNDNCIDIKDVMGFSTNENWRSHKFNIKKSIIPNYSLKPERMKSPILFKPIYTEYEDGNFFDIYIRFIPQNVELNNFLSSGKVLVENGKKGSFTINLPKEFSFAKFFGFIFDEDQMDFDIESYVDEKYHNTKKFQILKSIYNQIKENR